MANPGRRVGPYELREPLGGGFLSEVFRAWDQRSNAEVALKVLSPKLAGDPDTAFRFEREARVAMALSHPNIGRVLDVGRDGQSVYAAMELVRGVSLRSILEARAIDRTQAVRHAVQIAEAVAFAHSHGVLHRDLKPENIIVAGDGTVKVLDFGIAHAIEPASFDSMEVTAQHFHMRTGAVLVNVGYLAPEQLSGEPADERADVFSFGCILYEMVAGHQPFRGGTAPERMSAILTTSPTPPPPGSATESLERTILRCLEKEPNDRFQSMSEIAAELKSELGARGPSSERPRSAMPVAPPHPAPSRIWIIVATALIFVGLAGAAAAIWLLTAH